ncbi:hypothetical protein H9Q74_000014 [Fusarium xylarioides]|nr:hypothetical protein H9Q71_000127 [Fusarium xylarioides]KAG5829861.1 hypothetical protein H9Q74_000014 [Fusarium xylarioides]
MGPAWKRLHEKSTLQILPSIESSVFIPLRCNEAPSKGAAGKQATSSPGPSTKVLSKHAAEKQPASSPALNSWAPSEGAFMEQPAPKPVSCSPAPSSRQPTWKPRYVPRTQGPSSLIRRRASKPTASQMVREYPEGRGHGAQSNSTPASDCPSFCCWHKDCFLNPRTKACSSTSTASASRQHTSNLKAGTARVTRVTSPLKEVQLSGNEKGEALKAAATKKAEAAEKKLQAAQPIFDAEKVGLDGW